MAGGMRYITYVMQVRIDSLEAYLTTRTGEIDQVTPAIGTDRIPFKVSEHAALERIYIRILL